MGNLGKLWFELGLKDLTDKDIKSIEKRLKDLNVQVGLNGQSLKSSIENALRGQQFKIDVVIDKANTTKLIQEALTKAGKNVDITRNDINVQKLLGMQERQQYAIDKYKAQIENLYVGIENKNKKLEVLEERLKKARENTAAATARREKAERSLTNSEDAAIGSIKMLEAELAKLKNTYRSLSEVDRNSVLGKAMLTQINNADENLAKINAEMANNATLAKNMGTQYNGLRVQVSQVARELPNLGISLSTFIMSLSNNLPYLADEIAKAKKEFDNLSNAGKAATPVWKQMLGAVLNWQTALIVGVTIIVAYSREIQAWVQSIIKGNSAASILADTQKFLNELHEEAAKSASKELSQLQLLYGVTQDATRTVKERTAATEQLQKLFPEYFGKLSSETILVGNAKTAYDALTISIKNSEEARKISLENAALDEARIEAAKEKLELETKLNEATKELERQRQLPWFLNYKGIGDAELAVGHYAEALDRVNSKIKGIDESRKKLQKAYKPEITPEFDVLFRDMPEADVYKKTLADLDKQLAMYIIDQDEYNKKVNEAKGVLIAAADAANIGGSKLEELRDEYIAFNKIELKKKDKTLYIDIEKQRNEIEKANQLLKEAVIKAELDIEQTRINLMEDGSEKTIAQIQLDYQKRNAVIEKESISYLDKVRKAEREQWEKDNPNFKKDKLQFTSIIDLTNQLKTLGNQMNETFGKGNVDLLARPLVDAAELAKKGWKDAGEGIATVFSSSFQLNQAGREVMVHITPILPDGTVLSPDELEQYIDTILNDAENILQADNKKNGGLGVVLNVDTDLSSKIAEDFGEGLHLAQEKYYDLREEIKKNPLSIQVEDFQSQQKEKFQQSLDIQKKQVKDYFDSIAKEYQGYVDKRASIEEKFAKDRDVLKKGGASKATIKELDYQKQEALEQWDLLFAQRERTFRVWADQIAKLGVDQLRTMLIEAQAELTKLEINASLGKFGKIDEDEIVKYRAMIIKLREELEKSQKNETKTNTGEKDWQDLYKTLNEVDRSFQEIGDTIGGTVSEIIKAAGTVTSSTLQMVNSIVNLANWSVTATKMATDGATKTMIAVEKASVILTAISAGLKIVTGITGLFKRTDYMAEYRKEVAKLNDELKKVKENARIDSGEYDTIFGTDEWTNAKNNIDAARDALMRYNETLDLISHRPVLENASDLVKKLSDIGNLRFDDLNESIANMQVQIRHSTWFRSAKYASLKDAAPELFDKDGSVNMDALAEFVNSDMFKKLSEENQRYLQQMLDNWSAYEEAMDSVKNYLTGIFGDLGNTMMEALVDAFENGTDAAKKFTDSVSDMLEKLATNMIYSLTLGDIFEKAQNKAEEIMNKDYSREEDKFKDMTELMGWITDNAIKAQGDVNKYLEAWKQIAKDKGLDIFTPDNEKQNGLSSSIQGVTEDTAILLGSYLNAIRHDVSVKRNLLENIAGNLLPTISVTAQAQLQQLNAIAVNTANNAKAAEAIQVFLQGTLASVITQGKDGKAIRIK